MGQLPNTEHCNTKTRGRGENREKWGGGQGGDGFYIIAYMKNNLCCYKYWLTNYKITKHSVIYMIAHTIKLPPSSLERKSTIPALFTTCALLLSHKPKLRFCFS